ncbi:MAG: DNA (cytosine-5-)-methyltransferase [endosymbiont of Galathealinum brachiosum]|uniref:Cytosine-specific methyltransferase n=1 Tax=endosymbiont of Galathealinum brachiosum TaxID=2200906 RepID=A0A370DM39_9GAMM|nr:MAG: DNA (cytosine-5-)-methyltransferase [endosymbiont of Galathealinum brachiosum]
MSKKPVFVDLFAGCGGLSLGLEQAGFEPIFVSELNADAMESYLVNRKAKKGYPNLKDEAFSEHSIKDVIASNKHLDAIKLLKKDFGINEIDLVVGGPPCQGYSGIGHRRSHSVHKKNIPSNHLYQDMIQVIEDLQPKMFLFENVRGILTSRWTKKGAKGEIWKDVKNAFKNIEGYDIKWDLIRAYDYGVPQNRPRVLMVGIRRKKIKVSKLSKIDKPEANIKIHTESAIQAGFLPDKIENSPPDIEDLLGDLLDNKYEPKNKATLKYPKPPETVIQKEMRKMKSSSGYLTGDELKEHDYSKHSDAIVDKFTHMIEIEINGNKKKLPKEMTTKKFAQRVLPRIWKNGVPTITATSLPDDYVHYEQPRSLTVREWARLQTFPDWYQFKGKRTTGGVRRAGNPREGIHERELPKYTQIGNAVPVRLARAIGDHFISIINNSKA